MSDAPRIKPDQDLKYIAAPMVNQSDYAFRTLVSRHGATALYTQMYIPERLLHDQEYLEYHLRDLSYSALLQDSPRRIPLVGQLCGNDPDVIVQAGRKIRQFCDALDLNLGCPQEAARDNHYGAYLLGQKDWPVVTNIVAAMSQSFDVPVSAKLRLCQPTHKTVDLARQLEACGAAWITLHARTVSARRRRQGAADLTQVKILKDNLRVPVISNGNVRTYEDIAENIRLTGADGAMVGETLLGNPYHPGTTIATIQTHIRHFVEFQCSRRPWFSKFRSALGQTTSTDAIRRLVSVKVEKWRGRPPRFSQCHVDCGEGEDSDDEGDKVAKDDEDQDHTSSYGDADGEKEGRPNRAMDLQGSVITIAGTNGGTGGATGTGSRGGAADSVDNAILRVYPQEFELGLLFDGHD